MAAFAPGPALHLGDWDIEIVTQWWTGIRVVWFGPGQEPPVLPTGFHVLLRRWVERTFAWLDQYRRLSKDYERIPATSEAFLYTAMIRLMVRRLAHQQAVLMC